MIIAISKGLPWKLKVCVLHKGGRYVILKVFLVGVCAPHGDQLSFWEEIYYKFGKEDRDELIMMGDFNIIMNTNLDRSKATSTPGTSA